MGVTNHLLTPSWYLSRGHGKGNWREILLCKGNNNYHSQLIHGKKISIRMVQKLLKTSTPNIPKLFLHQFWGLWVFCFLQKVNRANFCVKSFPPNVSNILNRFKKGWWRPKNACVLASKGVMWIFKKNVSKGIPKKWTNIDPEKGVIISWKEISLISTLLILRRHFVIFPRNNR